MLAFRLSAGRHTIRSVATCLTLALGAAPAFAQMTWVSLSWPAQLRPNATTQFTTCALPPSASYPQGGVLFYGGNNVSGVALGETWIYDYSVAAWAVLGFTPPAQLGARTRAAMAFHPALGAVLFGGRRNGTAQNDAWVWSPGSGWSSLGTGAVPQVGRYDHSLVYDASANQLVCFGGYDNSGTPLSSTIVYSPNTWALQAPPSSPAARGAHGMTYDSLRARVVMFGGISVGGAAMNDLWEYDTNASTWNQFVPPSPLAGSGRGSAAFDVSRGRAVLLFSGSVLNEFDGSSLTWGGGSGGFSSSSVLQFDPANDRCVLTSNSAVSWSYHPTTFATVASAGATTCNTSSGQPPLLTAATAQKWQSPTGAVPPSLRMSNLLPNQIVSLNASSGPAAISLGNGCTQLIANPMTSFPLLFVDAAGSDLLQQISFPAGFVGSQVFYQFAMTDPGAPGGYVVSDAFTITAGSTL
jgi:hypothetical protein